MSETGDPPDDFARAYEAAAAQLFDRIERACRGMDEWPLGVRAAIEAVLALLAADPRFARLLLFEPYAAGRRAEIRHEETLAGIAVLLRRGRSDTAAHLPDLLEEGLVGGLVFIVARPLRAGEPERLACLGPELTALVLTPYLGRAEAERIAAWE